MDFLFNLLAPPLGIIMRGCYYLVQNVGVAIVIFTIIVRVAMFPISVKQQKTTSKTQIFTPKIKEIQTKYKNNNQKMQEEMAKLQKQGYNPMGGCLPGIITMLILFGVLGVVYKPMTYFERIDKEQIELVREIAIDFEYRQIDDRAEAANTEEADGETDVDITKEKNAVDVKYSRIQSELAIIGTYKANKEAFMNPANPEHKLEKETIDTLNELENKIMLFGIDFSEIPTATWPIILIPILSFLFAAGQMAVTQIIQRKTSSESVEQMGSMKYMMYFMPILSLVIAFQFPAGAGFYWALSSALGIVQSLLIYKLWPPHVLKAEVLENLEKKGFSADSVVVIEKPDGKKTTKKESEMSASERKEYYRKKLEEARKADLEKYGEVGAVSFPPEKPESESDQAEQNSDNEENKG